MEIQSSKPILVTGATGYISSQLIKQLLELGYCVRGTVRSLSNKEKYQFLFEIVPEKKDNLTLVEADLTNESMWSNAVSGCDYIFHVASPVLAYQPDDEMEIIKPAVEGTLNVLNAAIEQKCKKVVITSSVVAIIIGNDKECTEEDWSILEKTSHYAKSKILAEKTVWKFYEENKDKIEITVVNPSLVLGPTLSKHSNISEVLIKDILSGEFPGIPDPDVAHNTVDIRDVAYGHILALFSKESNGKRYIISNITQSIEEIVEILKNEFEKYGYILNSQKINGEDLIKSGNKVAIRMVKSGQLGLKVRVSNEKSIKELGLTYRNMKDSLIEMGYSLIKNQIIENKIEKI